jgi:DUF4097 and DUF4098 domain-containing protein YvlB
MKRIASLALVAWAATAALAHAAEYENELHAALEYHGGRVTIEHGFGAVHVHATSTSEVNVRGTVHASSAEIGRQVHFAASNSGGGVEIRTEYPRNCHNCSFSLDLEVAVPEGAPLSVTNRFGSSDIRGVHAPVEVTSNQGSVTVDDVRGNLTLSNRFGSVRASGITGNADIHNQNGSLELHGVGGSANIVNSFARVSVDDVTGSIDVVNQNGGVEVRNVKGSATLRNSFASTTAANIGRSLNIESQNGRVEANTVGGSTTIKTSFAPVDVRNLGGAATITSSANVTASDVRGPLTVDTRYGLVRAERIHGALDVDNSYGGVTANEIDGSARVHTSFASVFLKAVAGAVDVQTQNGSIAVSGLRGTCDPVTLKTSFSSIRVGIPNSGRYNIDARTTFGSVNTDVPITISRKTENTLTGTIGGGGCPMNLTTSNGSISITRE